MEFVMTADRHKQLWLEDTDAVDVVARTAVRAMVAVAMVAVLPWVAWLQHGREPVPQG
jgi:hypothetical protein